MLARHIHFRLFAGILLLSPLPLGSNRPVTWTLLALVVGLLCLAWPLVLRREPDAPVLSVRALALPLALFGACLAWAVLQTVPGLPRDWHHPLWAGVAGALAPEQAVAGRIGLSPSAAFAGILRLLCYAGIVWLAFLHAGSRRRAWRLVDLLALAGAAYALYGLWVQVTGARSILWMEKWAYQDVLTSTFVNRNSYATFAGLGILCALTSVLRRLSDEEGVIRPLRNFDRTTGLYALGGLAMVLALAATESRGGMLAMIAGLAAYPVLLFLAGRPARQRLVLGLVLGLGAVGLMMVLIGLVPATPGGDIADRQRIYRTVAGLIAERPWLGHGLGSFPAVMAMARTPDIAQVWTEAHQTYLEQALELGIPAACLLLLAILSLAAHCLLGRDRRPNDRLLRALALSATLLVAVHATVDFSMQIPAVAVTWAAIIGTVAGRYGTRAAGTAPVRMVGLP
ncbi:O-antigen ligase family protein [Niveispirillum sp. KHB5.9]|uniref:O-antigen ligase family protein n=1 Tax=Niveispirillum sp. KHB5.9 TaxID=3400269 RepID=UPI003A8A89A0